jgi:hypothetical protein
MPLLILKYRKFPVLFSMYNLPQSKYFKYVHIRRVYIENKRKLKSNRILKLMHQVRKNNILFHYVTV